MSDAGAKRKVLRAMLESGKLAAAPGAWNALAARLVEEAGFPAVYMTGGGGRQHPARETGRGPPHPGRDDDDGPTTSPRR